MNLEIRTSPRRVTRRQLIRLESISPEKLMSELRVITCRNFSDRPVVKEAVYAAFRVRLDTLKREYQARTGIKP